MSAATPGQAAYEAYRGAVFSSMPKWDELSHQAKSGWEAAAKAVAAQEPHAAPVCPRSSTPVTAYGEPHTDTCDLPEGHAGNHRCPGCGTSWTLLSDLLRERGRPWAADMIEEAGRAALAAQPQPAPVLHQLSGLIAGWRATARELDDLYTGRAAEVQAETLRGVIGQVLTVIERAGLPS